MIKSTYTHLAIEMDRLWDLAEIVVGIGLLMVCMLYLLHLLISATTKPNPNTSDIESVSNNQQVVLEHTNPRDQSGNTIVVYCDLPSYDRIYVLNGTTMYVEKGACAGLP